MRKKQNFVRLNCKNSNQERLKDFFARLRNPIVITSITSQVLIILTIINVNVNINAITKIVVAVCTILVSLGIMSNPTKTESIKRIKVRCFNCGRMNEYLMVDCDIVRDEDGNYYGVIPGETKLKPDIEPKPDIKPKSDIEPKS